jgi:hypothetical protein
LCFCAAFARLCPLLGRFLGQLSGRAFGQLSGRSLGRALEPLSGRFGPSAALALGRSLMSYNYLYAYFYI